MLVELIYDADCPNVATARSVLTEAFTRTGLPARWREWERGSADAPPYVKAFGSPTVLVDGKDIAGADADASAASCRVYRATDGALTRRPSLEALCNALGVPGHASPKPSRLRDLGASLPAIGTALLPKITCPLCWPAYTAALGALGLGFIDYTPFLFPATAMFLGIVIGSLVLAARRTRRYLPLGLGLISVAVVLASKFALDNDWLTNGGIALLIGATFLSARKQPPSAICTSCVASHAGEKVSKVIPARGHGERAKVEKHR